jgi:hypothetical protein
MLRLRAWIFFLFLLCIGALLVATAPSFQACVQQSGPPQSLSQPQRHGTTFDAATTTRECLSRFFVENRDDIIAGLALVLALSTIFLWFATRDLVAGTADFSKKQLRAYLGLSEVFISGVAVGEKPTVECALRNFGQTPAYRVSYWAEAKLLDSRADSFTPTQSGSERTVNPGRDGFTIKARLAEPLSEEDMSKIKLGTASIYFYGAISYRDAFSRRRKTEFLYQHGGPGLFGTEDLAVAPAGNKST